jgi:hypothetical protein
MQLVGIESMPKRNFQIFAHNFYPRKTLVNGEETKLLHVHLKLSFNSFFQQPDEGIPTGQ